MSKFARRLWKWIAAALAGVLILLGVGVGLFRAAVPLVPEWRAEAEAMAERALGWPVSIGAMDLRWAVFGPELVLSDVQLLAPDTWQPLISATQLDIVFGPLDAFQDGLLRPSHVRLHEPTLALERGADGVLYLSGYALPAGGDDSRVDWRRMLDLGLKHGRLTIIDGDLHYRDVARDIPDWQLHVREMTLASDGERHELDGTVLPPGVLGEQVAVKFVAEGPPAKPERWRWNLDLDARELHLAEWYRQFGWARTGTVRGLLGLSAELEGRGLEAVTGKGTLRASALGFTDFSPVVGPVTGTPDSFEQVEFTWSAAFGEERLGIDVTDLVIERADVRSRDGSISLRIGGADYPVEVAAFRLPLAELAGLARFLPVADEEGALARVRNAVRHLAPTGELQELILGIDTRPEPLRFHIQGAFRHLGAQAYGELPGFDGLSGTLRGTEAAGEVRLASRDVVLDLGDLFRSPRPVQALDAQLAWEKTQEEGWRITGTDIAVKNPEASATAAMTLDIPADGPVLIDLTGHVTDVDLRARSAWLPVGIMSDPLVHWLDTAILAGRVPDAAFTLRGPLGNFPFRDGSGVFDVRFTLQDAALEYAPGWPTVENLRADVHFNGPALDIRVEQAGVLESLAVTEGRARFPDLRDGLLEVSARVDGDVAAGWRFLAESPLRESLDGLLNALNVHGPLRADVALNIPLLDVDATSVRVTADLRGVDVKPVALPWTVEELRGVLTVTEHAASAERLSGSFTGSPFVASITPGEATEPEGFAATRIAMQGHSPVTVFEAFLPPEWLARLDGEFDWTGDLHVPGGGKPLEFQVDTPLAGVQSLLPAPLDVARPASARILLPGDGRIETAIEVSDLGASRLLFVETADGWKFERGRWLLGAPEAPELPGQAGLHVEGAADVLDVRGWLDLDNPANVDDGPAPQTVAARRDESILRSFDLDAARLLAGDLVLENQSLRGNRLGAGWEIALDGPATGSIRIPSLEDTGLPWDVRLDRLHLPGGDGEEPKGTAEEQARRVPDPRQSASLVLDIRDFRIGAMQLGRITGSLQRTAIGYTTQGLRADAPSFNITLDGRWEVINDEHYTSVSTVLESRDLGETLAKLGYASGGIDADDGRIEANLAWHAAPTAIDYGLLEGTVKFSARDGSLREVNPGAGRLIGLLSIAALPRRLMLDFSDFFGQGLYFDTLSGDFLLTDGNAYTTNARLEGPSISALLVGRTGLVARDYDQLAIVDTDVSASIPVAGYLAAGPTVGAALLLLSQLLKAPLADITQVKYRITGSWDDPVVERVQQASNVRTPSSDR